MAVPVYAFAVRLTVPGVDHGAARRFKRATIPGGHRKAVGDCYRGNEAVGSGNCQPSIFCLGNQIGIGSRTGEIEWEDASSKKR